MTTLDPITIYTDGGAAPNPGPGGWGALLIAASGTAKELNGGEPHTTNNRMELTAAVEALRALHRPCQVTFYTDSQYLRRGITEWLPAWRQAGWQRKGGHDVANSDLWRALAAETERHTIEWHWVKGHAGDPNNERVDRLATAGREAIAPESAPVHAESAPAAYEVAFRVTAPPGGAGGWAARISAPDGVPVLLHGRERGASSNRLELIAAQRALQQLPNDATIRIYCPSDYSYLGITRWIEGWRKRGWTTKDRKPVQNADLWRALDAAANAHAVQWAPGRDAPPDLMADLDRLAAQAARGELTS